MIVLHGGGENFGGGGAVFIHQDDQGDVVLAVGGVELFLVAVPVLSVVEQGFVQEQIGDFDAVIHPAPGIVPQVHDQGFHPFGLQIRIGLGEGISAAARELKEDDVAYLVIQHLVFHPIHDDIRLDQVKRQDLPLAHYLNLHLFAGFAAHDVDRVLHGGGGDLDILHRHEHVALFEARRLSRSIPEYPGDGDSAGLIVSQHLNADAGVLALILLLHLVPSFLRVVEGISVVQAGEQTLDRAVHELLLIRLLIKVGVDVVFHLVKHLILLQPLIFLAGDGDGILPGAGSPCLPEE